MMYDRRTLIYLDGLYNCRVFTFSTEYKTDSYGSSYIVKLTAKPDPLWFETSLRFRSEAARFSAFYQC